MQTETQAASTSSALGRRLRPHARPIVSRWQTTEITALPNLLRQIDVKGAGVTLDAMCCQKKIAQEIHFAGAHCVLRHDQTIKDTMRGNRISVALCEKTLGTLLKLNILK